MRPRSSAWAVVAAVFAALWAVAVTVGSSATGWLTEQVMLLTGDALSWWAWPAVGLVAALLVAAPAVPLAMVPRSPGVRAAGRAWSAGAVAMGVLGLARAIPPAHHEAYLAVLAVLAAAGAVLLRRRTGPEPGRAAGFAAAAGLAVALPWLAIGALGGLLETLLAVAAGAAVGWLVRHILPGAFWRPYAASRVRTTVLGGLVAGVALLLVAAGTGHAGSQLAELLVLPPLGFALGALQAVVAGPGPVPHGYATYQATQPASRPGEPASRPSEPAPQAGPDAPSPAVPATAAPGWLVGIAAAAPLTLVDPEEVTLLLATARDVPAWTAIAAGVSLLVALLVGALYAVAFARRAAVLPGRRVGAAAAALLALAGTVVYAGPGQPGLHGERLFVIMKEQADLSGVDTARTGPAGRDARIGEVHRRLVDTARRSQADLRRDLDRWRLSYTPYYLVNAVEVRAGPGVRAWLSRRSDVDRVLLGQWLRPLPAGIGVSRGDQPTAPPQPPWGIAAIGADRVRTELGVDGRQIVVGTSDSGVDGRHPALAGTFRGGEDSWHDPWNRSAAPTDHGGHGTHTLGTAVGGRGIGVAPGAGWVGCVNLDRNLGNPARYLDCLQFMLAPFPAGADPFTAGRPARAPHVLTNSWGCPAIEGCDRDALRTATAAFAAAGVFFVAAAGNTGPSCGSIDTAPAPYADALTVGAVDRSGRVAEFSSRGPAAGGAAKPDVVAPGADVLSAMPGGTYGSLDGTSMATPHVAGTVALMWSANPRLVGDLPATARLIRDTAKPVAAGATPGCGPAAEAGAGTIDAYAAVLAARRAG